MHLSVRISNLDTGAYVDVDALIDVSQRRTVVPSAIANRLRLPEYARIDREGEYTITPIAVGDEAVEVVISRGTLTGLLLRLDRETEELLTEEARI